MEDACSGLAAGETFSEGCWKAGTGDVIKSCALSRGGGVLKEGRCGGKSSYWGQRVSCCVVCH